ncbi:ion channel [Yeosuana sp. MJ-SS3]|uniref:Ion channel n=1 Tax=Gilvirhabdus luticola TaxID=3079858 RepID=A0ABU3U527_9FLAO|nr:ion channel [Yeosuana sp. MJ-SS3]MDU8885419.1 ion channel [Yeosuana sp. MJ-SS3]
MINKLHTYRFELFFFSIVSILFGSLFFPKALFADTILPILFLINIIAGLLFFIEKRRQSWITFGLFLIVLLVLGYKLVTRLENASLNYLRFIAYFIFYVLTTLEIIRQVWNAERVNKSVIYGLMSGYIALGLLSFFTYFCIELIIPGSFSGIDYNGIRVEKVDALLYYSYISLMTIGYGDITPVNIFSQKASIFFAMIGQFYLVIITAVVIEKYIRHSNK